MSEARALRSVFREAEEEFRKEMRKAERILAMSHGVLYKGEFVFASITMTKGALILLGEKLRDIGTVLAFKAELMALGEGKTSIDKGIMRKVLDELEKTSGVGVK